MMFLFIDPYNVDNDFRCLYMCKKNFTLFHVGLCSNKHFLGVSVKEWTDTALTELIVLEIKLGSCCNSFAMVLLFWCVCQSFPPQRETSGPSNMIQTTSYLHSTLQSNQYPELKYTKDKLIQKSIFLVLSYFKWLRTIIKKNLKYQKPTSVSMPFFGRVKETRLLFSVFVIETMKQIDNWECVWRC